jgi:hypothetical protein
MIKKTEILDYFFDASYGTGKEDQYTQIADKLAYGHFNSIARLKSVLTKDQDDILKMRMRAAGIKIPKHW